VRAFVADPLERWKPLTALDRYRGLQAFFKWAVAEGELGASPMAGINPPQIPDEPPPMLTDDELRRLLKAARAATSPTGETRPSCGCSSTRACGCRSRRVAGVGISVGVAAPEQGRVRPSRG
jgi:integrase